MKEPTQFSLDIAIKSHMTMRAKELIDQGGVNGDLELRNSEGYSPLHLAITLKDYEIARYLLDKGANPNAYHPQGWSILHTATDLQNAKAVKLLLKAGANPHAKITSTLRRDYGWNCLHGATRDGNTEIATILLNHGLNLNSTTPDGQTPLMIAIEYKKVNMIEFLVKRGANLSLKDKWGSSAVLIAKENGLETPLKGAIIEHKILKELKRKENIVEI